MRGTAFTRLFSCDTSRQSDSPDSSFCSYKNDYHSVTERAVAFNDRPFGYS
jgi:hypothetical protein